MKNNKLPIMSDAERQKAWEELKPNSILVHIEWNNWGDGYNIKQLKVIKRTPKGNIRLDNGELLKWFSHGYHIITSELKEWFEKIRLEEEIWTMIHLDIPRNKKEFKNNLTYEDAKILKEIFERTLKKED